LNLFSVKLTELKIPELDEMWRGIRVISQTLEEAPWEEYNYPDIDELEDEDDPSNKEFLERKELLLHQNSVRALDGYVPATAVWFKKLGDCIYNMEGETYEYDWNPIKWSGGKVYSKERFQFWIERFEWISTVTALERKTRDIAKDTAQLMRSITEK